MNKILDCMCLHLFVYVTMSLPHDAMIWYAVCDCDIFWSYSLVNDIVSATTAGFTFFGNCMFYVYVFHHICFIFIINKYYFGEFIRLSFPCK